MLDREKRFLRSTQTIVGSVIGVGIFGLPYVVAQAGFLIGLIHLLVVGFVYTVALILYAEVIMYTPGKMRIAGLAERYLGHHWRHAASLFQYSNSWGAMIGYVVLGGGLLHALLATLTGGSEFLFQLVFFGVASLVLLGGLGLVSWVESYFFWTILLLSVFLVVAAIPNAEIANLFYTNLPSWTAPLGVALFAYGGFAAIPEAADILRGNKDLLRRSTIFAMVFCAAFYVLFTMSVVLVTGEATTEDALLGFSKVVGDWFLTVSGVIALYSIFSSYIVLGMSNIDGLVYDFRWRYLTSWLFVIAVPLVFFLIGARDFISVIGFTGGVIGSFIGLIVVRIYKKARRDVCMPKRCLTVPSYVIWFVQAVFILGIIVQLKDLL